jgi:hypothetical protein
MNRDHTERGSVARPLLEPIAVTVPATVGVFPVDDLRTRQELFDALSSAFTIRFVGLSTTAGEQADASIIFGPSRASVPSGGKTLLIDDMDRASTSRRPGLVTFDQSRLLDSRLRGRSLKEARASDTRLSVDPGAEILARVGERPVWTKERSERGEVDQVAQSPGKFEAGEVLRDHLSPGNFLGLVPLVHFLRELTSETAWDPPATRASFVIDDPNLHRPSYGYLDLARVMAEAGRTPFHLAIAMIPLDGWFAHRGAVDLMRRGSRYLSLAIHGNNHTKGELRSVKAPAEALALVAQALRRVARFEEKTGLSVSRVMVPPHEACSAVALRAMADLGVEAVSMTRPYSWVTDDRGLPYGDVAEFRPLAGWMPSEFVHSGVPIIVRRGIGDDADAVLRAYIGQPVIQYCHVADLRDGLERLVQAANAINENAGVRWCSLEEISRTNFEMRRRGAVLEVRPFSHHVQLAPGSEIEEVRIVPPPPLEAVPYQVRLVSDGMPLSEFNMGESAVSWRAESGVTLEVIFRPSPTLDPQLMPDLPFPVGAVARRLLTEMRDRAQPVFRGRLGLPQRCSRDGIRRG